MLPRDRMVYGSSSGETMAPHVVVDAREHSLIELFKTHAEGY